MKHRHNLQGESSRKWNTLAIILPENLWEVSKIKCFELIIRHYIEGIHNLYEFDCGDLSGWMYKVNGWFPNYGCSRYQLKQGDVIEWVYTCDLGKDVGGGNAVGQGAAS